MYLRPRPDESQRPTLSVDGVDAPDDGVRRSQRSPWRARTATAGLALVVASMAACSSPAATPATSSTPATTTPATAFGWLKSVAEPWNHKLNTDQFAVLKDSKPTSNESSSTFFSRLAASCTKMLDDAQRAGQISRAPSASLDSAWRNMVTQTVTYSSDCVTVAKGQSASAIATWTTSLAAMDSANSAFNAAVTAVHPEATGTTSTTGAAG